MEKAVGSHSFPSPSFSYLGNTRSAVMRFLMFVASLEIVPVLTDSSYNFILCLVFVQKQSTDKRLCLFVTVY